MKTKVIYGLAVLVIIVAAAGFWLNLNNIPNTGVNNPSRYMDIESYVRNDISNLSPVKEQLGGTFQVTDIQTNDGKGVVSYEDGHHAYTADFTYMVAEDGNPTITSFTVR